MVLGFRGDVSTSAPPGRSCQAVCSGVSLSLSADRRMARGRKRGARGAGGEGDHSGGPVPLDPLPLPYLSGETLYRVLQASFFSS